MLYLGMELYSVPDSLVTLCRAQGSVPAHPAQFFFYQSSIGSCLGHV